MAFSNDRKRETWLFKQVASDGDAPVWERLKFNIVYYDGEVDGFIEPVSHSVLTQSNSIAVSANEDLPRVTRFEFLRGAQANIFRDVHRFD